MILSAQSIRKAGIFTPFHERTIHECGMSYGLSSAGYDVRIKERVWLGKNCGHSTFSLASTLEHFAMPDNLLGKVADKSTWARRGLAVQNTIIEPGWRGFLTLELTYHGTEPFIEIPAGAPIAQIILCRLDEPTEQPYSNGKYQDQPSRPVAAIMEPFK